jgi:hypothetical protein
METKCKIIDLQTGLSVDAIILERNSFNIKGYYLLGPRLMKVPFRAFKRSKGYYINDNKKVLI